jgi:hypothetical protein
MLKVTHNAGFFSCCTIKLIEIIKYFNENKKLPDVVDSSEQFRDYKDDLMRDVTYDYFKLNDDIIIDYIDNINLILNEADNSLYDIQFIDYQKLNFDSLKPFIKKYFSPSDNLLNMISEFENKYNINYENTCAIRYRGNDKYLETVQPSYKEIIEKAKLIKEKNNNICFLVQTDELDFLLEFFKAYPENTIHIKEIPITSKMKLSMQYIIKQGEKYKSTITYISSMFILSKCKYIITTSGNGELWIALYKGNANNIYQYYKPLEYVYGKKNNMYDINKIYFWYDN